MTIIIFLLDTSASMNQRTYLGTTLLDVAKGTVENFMKLRSRDNASRMDRYMLMTLEEPPANVKAGWKESHATFTTELKNLKTAGLTQLGPALKQTFDLLNVNRMQSGIETYGQGRFPFYLEPAVIICITDGRKLTNATSVQNELHLPLTHGAPGSELTHEPFRWDQRLFGIVLRFPAVPPGENLWPYIPSAEDHPLDAMCEVTGGRSYKVSSQRSLMQSLESLVQKVQAGVVINFEKFGPEPSPVNDEQKLSEEKYENQNIGANGLKRASTPTPSGTAWQVTRKLIYVQRSAQKGYSVGNWPIPEAFWPDLNSSGLPPRDAQPNVKFSCTPCEAQTLENLPFDKYELEPSPLTQYILERRQPGVAWQVFVSNSGKYSDIGHPFGYIKASTNLSCVNLFVMPYNYPILLPLLDELFKIHKCKPTMKWRQQFDNYLKTMPIYYGQPLRRALGRMGVSNLVPDQMDNSLSYSVVSYLKKLKNQAKVEYEKLIASVGTKSNATEPIKVTSRSQNSLLERKDFSQLLQHYGGDITQLKQQLNEITSFTLAVKDRRIKPQAYRNAYDIERGDLLDQVTRMRVNFFHQHKLQQEDLRHNVPVSQMGNYQEYLKLQPSPLRELEIQPVRQHMFGNPFKVNKNLMIDEADEAMPGQASSGRKRSLSTSSSGSDSSLSPGPRKRKPGPLPKDLPYRRLTSPLPSSQPEGNQSPLSHVNGDDVPLIIVDVPSSIDKKVDLMQDISNEPPDKEGLKLNLSNHVQNDESRMSHKTIVSDKKDLDKRINHNDKQSPEVENAELVSILAPPINGKKWTAVLEHNQQLQRLLLKEVRKPGKDFSSLFQKLRHVQGGMKLQQQAVHVVIKEASRFKRRALVDKLRQFERTLLRPESSSSLTNSNGDAR